MPKEPLKITCQRLRSFCGTSGALRPLTFRVNRLNRSITLVCISCNNFKTLSFAWEEAYAGSPVLALGEPARPIIGIFKILYILFQFLPVLGFFYDYFHIWIIMHPSYLYIYEKSCLKSTNFCRMPYPISPARYRRLVPGSPALADLYSRLKKRAVPHPESVIFHLVW